jgi:hypothetical protein
VRSRKAVVPGPSSPARVATKGPTAAWAKSIDIVTDPPPLEDLDGQAVRWEDWEIAPEISHLPQECERCGYDGQPWTTFGTVIPETAATVACRGGQVPARPIKRIWVRRCPACEACVVYDLGSAGKEFKVLVDATGQAALF